MLIQRLGYEIGFEPKAVVTHDPGTDRFNLQYLRKTILAGERTWYQLQRDLYIPNQLSFRRIYRRFKDKLKMRSVWGPLKTRYALLAEWHLFWWFFHDQICRLKKLFDRK